MDISIKQHAETMSFYIRSAAVLHNLLITDVDENEDGDWDSVNDYDTTESREVGEITIDSAFQDT
ncbi:unnamed protein product, partial [Aphanomyces euteiches]